MPFKGVSPFSFPLAFYFPELTGELLVRGVWGDLGFGFSVSLSEAALREQVIEMMSSKELEQIRRRYDEYSPVNQSAYRAFMFEAHRDVGKLIQEIDRLTELEERWGKRIGGGSWKK